MGLRNYSYAKKGNSPLATSNKNKWQENSGEEIEKMYVAISILHW
jgi:hypothetical protein